MLRNEFTSAPTIVWNKAEQSQRSSRENNKPSTERYLGHPGPRVAPVFHPQFGLIKLGRPAGGKINLNFLCYKQSLMGL